MIITYTGDRGSGKTLSMVAQAYRDHKEAKKKVFSNMKGLTFPHTPITKEDLLKYAEENTQLSNCVLLIDEAHIFADSRRSMKKSNLILTYLLLMSRKRDVDIYLTTQDFGQVDKRFRQQTDVLVECESEKILNKNNEVVTLIFQTISTKYNVTRRILVGNLMFKLYDTAEVIPF